MSENFCPLCKQVVSKALYEKITGVWQEKEKRLADLKIKERQLLQREKQMQIRFEQEKKKIVGREQEKFKKELIVQKQVFQNVRFLQTQDRSILNDYSTPTTLIGQIINKSHINSKIRN